MGLFMSSFSSVKSATKHDVASASAVKTKMAALFAMLIGGAIVLFVGFSHIDAVHNAAHDTRHSFAFPCH